MHSQVIASTDSIHTQPNALESECAWLHALDAETDLVVQRPVQRPDGRHVLAVEPPAGGPPVSCTLLSWVEGDIVSGERSPELAGQLGSLLAALHDHADDWTPPPWFQRPTHDRGWTRESLRRIGALAEEGLIAPGDHRRLAEAAAVVERELVAHARVEANTGLIHADLHESNYVVLDGAPRPIDFSRCGSGPWLYDLGECLMHLTPPRRRDLVEAYGRSRPLVDGDLRRLEGYMIASCIEGFGHHAPDPREREYVTTAIPRFAARHVQRYLDGETYLFEI